MSTPAAEKQTKQLLHLVFGGELKALDTIEFANLQALDIVGVYPNWVLAIVQPSLERILAMLGS